MNDPGCNYTYTDSIIGLISDFVEYMTEITDLQKRMPQKTRPGSSFVRERLCERIRYSLLLDGYAISGEFCRQALTNPPVLEDSALSESDSAYSEEELSCLRMARVLTEPREDFSVFPETMLEVHRQLMEGLCQTPGEFRSRQSVRFESEDEMRILPVSAQVPRLMGTLTDWYRRSKVHPLLRSLIFCFRCSTIEPFSHGGSRLQRVWLGLLLERWRPVLRLIPFETFLYRRKNEHDRILSRCLQSGDCTMYLEFMLRILYCALQAYDEELRSGTEITPSMQKLLSGMQEGETYTNRELMDMVSMRHRPTFRDNYLLPCIDAGLIEMTVPDKPNSRNQRYRRLAAQE